MGNIGAWELIIIAVLVLVIFGGKKLPELGRGLGRGLANFRQAVKEPGPAGEPSSAARPGDGAADKAGRGENRAEFD
jgi:sec-independent protein translocase protein TatA